MNRRRATVYAVICCSLAAATLFVADSVVSWRADAHDRYVLAAVAGDAGRLRALRFAGASIEARRPGSDAPLITAAFQPKAVRLLVEAGADVNATNSRGGTPLIALLRFSPPRDAETAKVARLLIDRGADVNAHTSELHYSSDGPAAGVPAQITPLLLAIEKGQYDLAKELLLRGADPNVGQSLDGAAPLWHAMTDRRFDVARLMLDRGADPDARPLGAAWSALHTAVWQQDPGLVRALLAHGANPNVRGIDGETPLMHAVWCNSDKEPTDQLVRRTEIVRALLASGADVHARSNAPIARTPLEIAAVQGNTPEIRQLLAANANPRL